MALPTLRASFRATSRAVFVASAFSSQTFRAASTHGGNLKSVLPKHAAEWGVDDKAVAVAADRVDTEWGERLHPYRTDRDVMTGLTLLYVKQPPQLFKDGATVGERIVDLLKIVKGRGAYAGAKKRLLRLVTLAHDKGAATPPDTAQAAIDAFYAAIPAWSSPATSTVFFRDVIPGSDVYRVQLSRNCFMHAPDVVAHYVVCKNNPAMATMKEMIDLTAYVLKYFDGERLWKYMYEDSGGHSIDFLLEITGLTEDEIEEWSLGSPMLTADMVVKRLKKFGPALVSTFQVIPALRSADHTFVGRRRDDPPVVMPVGMIKKPERHAMALVGWRRREEDGKIVFLIQNWCTSKQFFECDIEFLRSRRASLVWITSKLTKLPENLPRTFQGYVENELTGDDCAPEEG